jgi:hypothetical protein
MSIAKILGAGSAVNTREKDDFYETPVSVTEQLCVVEREHLPQLVWEPSSGKGAITRVLRRHGINVVESDLISRVGQQQLDFLKAKQALAPAIITNPPFKIATQYVLQARNLGVTYLALLLKLGFLATRERQKLFSTVGHPMRTWVLADRPDFLKQGAPTMDCAWFVWEGWGAPYSVTQTMPLNIPTGDGVRSRKTIVGLNGNSAAAERTAARLLCQYPGIEFNDPGLVIDRCLEFKVDLRAQNTGYTFEHVERGAQQLRARAATMASTSWPTDELWDQSDKLHDTQKDWEQQSLEFYAALAHYQLVKLLRNSGDRRYG